MDDHQTANAKPLAEAGAAVLAQEAGLTGEALAGHIRAILEDATKSTAMADAARALGRPNAASELADLVERLAEEN
jgi:UDP-N-acetylglucosamine--N-acetylmuramyl-(pentapeptide) pyrophosphoryl-undecaprenol N-acetylglucosamine transferase